MQYTYNVNHRNKSFSRALMLLIACCWCCYLVLPCSSPPAYLSWFLAASHIPICRTTAPAELKAPAAQIEAIVPRLLAAQREGSRQLWLPRAD